MHDDLQQAKLLLQQGGYTCVLYSKHKVYTSNARGVRPLLAFLDSGEDLHGFFAADKVVGKATAFLYCLLGVQEVYAHVMSQSAAAVLSLHGIAFYCEQLVDAIANRQNTGPCPMEAATADVQTPEAALVAVRAALRRLQG